MGDNWPPNCYYCGKFVAHADMSEGGGGGWMFVPSSDAPSYEETGTSCRKCTDKHGPPIPFQTVVREKCCGRY